MAKKKSKKFQKAFAFRKVVLISATVLIVLTIVVAFTTSRSFSIKSFSLQKPTPTPVLPTVTPSITPTPTITPTPSPTPLSGYCLYVPVLMYHHVQPQAVAVEKGQTALNVDSGTFDAQMAYIASKGYTTITTTQLVNALITKSGLPAKSMVLTFDDGYKNNFDYAHPIVQKYGLTANFVLSTGLVGGENYVSWDQVQQMVNSGRWHMVNHTWSHYSLGKGDLEKIKYEVSTAQQQIQQYTGQNPTTFAYPYGTLGGADILKSMGIQGAFSTIPGSLQCDSILFQLRRTRIGNSPLSSYGF